MSDIPSNEEIQANLKELVKQGLMEEVSPGKFKLTPAGEDYAAGLAKTQQGAAIIAKLDKATRRKHRYH